MVLLFPLTILVAALPTIVLGGEFPVHNGVVGGPPAKNPTSLEGLTETVVDEVASQLGGLRYVENSGVCGNTHSPEG